MAVRKIAACLAFLFCSAMAAALAQGAEPELAVRLASGRQFQGAIDPTSTTEQLVLRTVSGGITLRRPIRWESVQQAMVDGNKVEVASLRASAAKNKGQAREDRGQGTGDRGKGSLLRKIELRGETAPASGADRKRERRRAG